MVHPDDVGRVQALAEDALLRASNAQKIAEDALERIAGAEGKGVDALARADNAQAIAEDGLERIVGAEAQGVDALARAGNAQRIAEEALGRIVDAEAQGVDALARAGNAQRIAEEALGRIVDAEAQGLDALARAGNAQAIAEQALERIVDAEAQGVDALTRAGNAQKIAEDAGERSSAAEGRSLDALTRADNARDVADGALDRVVGAEAQGADALSRASNAQAVADDALERAATAQAQGEDAVARADDAHGLADDALQRTGATRALAEDALARAEVVRAAADDAAAVAKLALDTAREVLLPGQIAAFGAWLDLCPPIDGPLISVILPTRDRPALLPRAVASLLEQLYDRWELIVVDDGETDAVERTLADVEDDRVVTVDGPRRGPDVARNAGLDSSSGEIVCYLDDDNVMHPLWLRAVAHVFMAREDVDVAYGVTLAEHRSPGSPDPADWWPAFWQLPWSREKLLEQNLTDMGALAHRRDLPQARFEEGTATGEDWDLLIRLTADRPALPVPAISHAYAVGGGDHASSSASHLAALEKIRRRHSG